jgi:hypothetical protein
MIWKMSHVGSGFPIEGVLERQLKSWRLEAVRNGGHRPDRETRCGKSSISALFHDRGRYRKLVLCGEVTISNMAED